LVLQATAALNWDLQKTTALERRNLAGLSRCYSKHQIILTIINKKEGIEQFTGFEPIGRFGLPEEIANAVVHAL
jgi:hypothetical protein